MHISNGKLNEGFKDLYLIESAEMFPKQLLEDVILPSLSIPQKEALLEQEFYLNAPISKRFDENSNNLQSVSIDINDDSIMDLEDLG